MNENIKKNKIINQHIWCNSICDTVLLTFTNLETLYIKTFQIIELPIFMKYCL